MVARWRVVVAGGLLLWTACLTERAKSQHKFAQRLRPDTMEAGSSPRGRRARRHGEPRMLRVRVYASEAYRHATLMWKERFEARLDHANRVLIPSFGVGLELVDSRSWTPASDAVSLPPLVAELIAQDDGRDVDFVIGLVAAAGQVTTSIDHLGMADLLGKHIVLRGMDSLEEMKALHELDELSKEEREQVYQERKAHKEVAVLLHELGHSLGALHVTDESCFMFESYSNHQVRYCQTDGDVMLVSLRYRGADAAGTPAEAAGALLAWLGRSETPLWSRSERAELVAMLQASQTGARASAGGAGGGVVAPARSAEDHATLLRASRIAQAGNPDKAWKELEPLLVDHPDDVDVRRLACQIAAARRPPDLAQARRQCLRAAELAPADAWALITLAFALETAKDADVAGVIDQAAARLRDAPTPDGDAWLQVAGLRQRRNEVTWAEEAALQAGGALGGSVQSWADLTRRRYGLPHDAARFGVPPAREGAYLAAVQAILLDAQEGRIAAARAKARRAAADFPDSPGPHVASCDLEARAGKPREARKHCERAIALYGEATWAHYLVAMIAAREHRAAEARGHLARVVELDPSLDDAWVLLAHVLDELGEGKAGEELRAEYRKRFGRELR